MTISEGTRRWVAGRWECGVVVCVSESLSCVTLERKSMPSIERILYRAFRSLPLLSTAESVVGILKGQ